MSCLSNGRSWICETVVEFMGEKMFKAFCLGALTPLAPSVQLSAEQNKKTRLLTYRSRLNGVVSVSQDQSPLKMHL